MRADSGRRTPRKPRCRKLAGAGRIGRPGSESAEGEKSLGADPTIINRRASNLAAHQTDAGKKKTGGAEADGEPSDRDCQGRRPQVGNDDGARKSSCSSLTPWAPTDERDRFFGTGAASVIASMFFVKPQRFLKGWARGGETMRIMNAGFYRRAGEDLRK